jgi:hypothetical protein
VLLYAEKYVLKLLLNIVTAGIEALVLGNKFLYACVKGVCCLWAQPHFDTFHQLITVEALWSQPVLQVGKQVVVARSEVMNVRRVANNSQFKCSISAWVRAAVCRHTLSWRNTTLYVSIPCLLFWLALRSSFEYFSAPFWHYCGPLLREFLLQRSFPILSQKTVAISFLADNICLNFFDLFGKCVCIRCFHCSLVSTFTNETEVSSPVTLMMWLRNSLPSLWYHSKKVKAEAIPCILCSLVSIFRTHLAQNLW